MPDKTPPPATPSDPDDELSLNEALSDLEHMLDGRPDGEDTELSQTESTVSGEQYTIPLLDDVLVPGVELIDEVDDIDDPVPAVQRQLTSVEDDASQAIIERLTNEVEVIVQTGVEQALQEAMEVITERVRKHVNIILPEILDEIADLKARKNQL